MTWTTEEQMYYAKFHRDELVDKLEAIYRSRHRRYARQYAENLADKLLKDWPWDWDDDRSND